jgi:multiple sugar transport system substrate-binding protein
MRRFSIGLALLLLTLSVLGLFGCGGSGKQAANKALTIWGMGVEGEKLKEIVAKFKEENPDIELSIQPIPWGQAHEKLITAVAGGLAPDISQFGTTWIPEFVSLQALEPLDDFIKNSQTVVADKYFKGSWDTGVIDGVSYGIPWYVDTRVLFYRKDLLAEVGYSQPPRTWDQLKDAARKLVQKNAKGEVTRAGILLPPMDAKTLLMFAWSNNGDVLAADGQVTIDSPENVEALTYYASFFREGLSPISSEGGTELYNNFKNGYAPMFIGGPWMIKDILTYAPELESQVAVAVMPMKKTATSFVGGSDWCILKDSKNKEAAWKFIEYMSRPEIQVQWYQLTTDLPTRTDAWEDKYFSGKPLVKVFGQQLFDTKTPPRIQQWEEIESLISREMEQAVMGKNTPQKTLAAMAEKIRQILARAR